MMTSSVLGALIGTIFSVIDVEDYAKGYHRILMFLMVFSRDLYLCEPLGFVLGGFSGFMLIILRSFTPV